MRLIFLKDDILLILNTGLENMGQQMEKAHEKAHTISCLREAEISPTHQTLTTKVN